MYIGESIQRKHYFPAKVYMSLIQVGIMSQIVTDLGIHASSEVQLRSINEELSAIEIAARRKNFFWNAFTASV